MRRRALGLALLLSLLALPAAARRLPFKPGESHTFSSPSKRWSVQIIYVKNPNTGPCKAVLRDGRKVVWRRDWPATPGSVTVPDDGAAFCALDFLNYDEHWYRAVSFYGKDGALLRQVPYVSPAEPQNATTTRWLRGCRLEPGKAVVEHCRGADRFTAEYALPTGKLLGEKRTGSCR